MGLPGPVSVSVILGSFELAMKKAPVVDAPLNGDKPEVYMMKAAVLRRHLTDDQRKCIAVLWIDEKKSS